MVVHLCCCARPGLNVFPSVLVCVVYVSLFFVATVSIKTTIHTLIENERGADVIDLRCVSMVGDSVGSLGGGSVPILEQEQNSKRLEDDNRCLL